MQNANKYNTFKRHDAKKRRKLFKFWDQHSLANSHQGKAKIWTSLTAESSSCAGEHCTSNTGQRTPATPPPSTQCWWGTSIPSTTTTAPGWLLVACLVSALHSWFHLNCTILNERKRTRFPSVPRRGKVWATPDQGLFFNIGQDTSEKGTRNVWTEGFHLWENGFLPKPLLALS